MTAQPAEPGPDTGAYEVIHLGGQAAVVVPVADFLRLRALEQAASPQVLEDAEDTAALPDAALSPDPASGRAGCGAVMASRAASPGPGGGIWAAAGRCPSASSGRYL